MQPSPPPSISNNAINVTGVAAAVAAFFICKSLRVEAFATAFAVCIAFAATVLALEVICLKSYKRPSTGLDWNKRDYSARRTAIKCLGLYGTFAILGVIYYVSPEYHDFYYRPFWQAVKIVLPIVLALSIPYIAFVDARMTAPRDGLYQTGLCFLGRWNEATYNDVMQYALGWVVKGFFLPLMWTGFCSYILHIDSPPTNPAINTYGVFFTHTLTFIMTIDVMLGSMGYTFTLRATDTHIRNVDNSLLGWFVCIICYLPYVWMIQHYQYTNYESQPWVKILEGYPAVQMVWGSAILFLFLVNFGHTLQFGCRFSNLTNRGIITNGLYRFTKHPAYLSKNVAWWIMALPFTHYDEWQDKVLFTLFLLFVNVIYFMRARAEERHLSSDPDYVQYALWMNEHSMFRHLTRPLPCLKYQPAVK